MAEDKIRKRVDKIRNLISEARYDEAFQGLEQLIIDIDGAEVEHIRERELLDQLIAVKSRYNFFKTEMIKGIKEGNTELNQITSSLISLTNELKKMGTEDPHLFKSEDVEEKEYTAQMATEKPMYATHDVTRPIEPVSDGSENSGCLVAIGGKNAKANVEIKDVNWSNLILKILLGLFLIAGIIFLINRGCSDPGPIIIPPPIDTTPPPPVKEVPEPEPEPEPEPIDRARIKENCNDLRLRPGSLCDLANYLSDSDDAARRRIELEGATFNKSSLSFENSTLADQQLSDLVKLMQAYPDLEINIYGYFFEGEDEVIKGANNKEFGLDDMRAKKIYEMLRSKGIDRSRIDFEGDGDSNRAAVWIEALFR